MYFRILILKVKPSQTHSHVRGRKLLTLTNTLAYHMPALLLKHIKASLILVKKARAFNETKKMLMTLLITLNTGDITNNDITYN